MKREGQTRLADHLAECRQCAVEVPLDRISDLLASAGAVPDAAALSRRVMVRLAPEVQRMGARALRQRVALALALSVVPLVAVIAYDVVFFNFLHNLLSRVLPPAIATLMVFNYAAFVVFAVAATYAAIPILLANRRPPRTA